MVAAWISALTGVGPSIASGSHVWRGIWADFPIAPKNINIPETGSLFEETQAKLLAQEKAELLQSKIAQYIFVVSKTNKENLKQEIDNLKWDLIEATLEENGEESKLDE